MTLNKLSKLLHNYLHCTTLILTKSLYSYSSTILSYPISKATHYWTREMIMKTWFVKPRSVIWWCNLKLYQLLVFYKAGVPNSDIFHSPIIGSSLVIKSQVEVIWLTYICFISFWLPTYFNGSPHGCPLTRPENLIYFLHCHLSTSMYLS